MNTGIIAPLTSLSFMALGTGYFLTFITVYLNTIGINEQTVGAIHSVFYFGLVVGAYRSEKEILLIGHIRAYATYTAIMAATVLVQSMYYNEFVWAFLRFIYGYCVAGLYVVIEGWLLALSEPKNRGRTLAIYVVALYGAQALSPYLLDYVPLHTLYPYVCTALIACLAMIPVLITTKMVPEIKEAPKIPIFTFIKKTPLGLFGCFVSGMILSSVYAFAPNYAQEYNLRIPSVVSTVIVGGMLLPFVFGRLSDVFDRRYVLLATAVVLAPICFVAHSLLFNHYLFFAFLFLFGGITFAFYPICISRVIDFTSEEHIIPATGLALLFYGIGSIIGPSSIPLAFNIFGIYSFWSFFGVLCFIFSITLVISIARDKRKEPASAPDFVTTTHTTAIVNELDPRT